MYCEGCQMARIWNIVKFCFPFVIWVLDVATEIFSSVSIMENFKQTQK